ncbi:DegT/DnrJ/EryC1/StrS family aminotransferase [Parahaliea aestuarii]|nr:DegT/DnrJ/EryC1/StrS family aminotransferase [Parahaliea aestuarii]
MPHEKLPPRVVRYGGATYGEDEIQQVNAVLADPNGMIPGARVGEFEARVAAFMGKRHGVMVNSGSSALMIAMRLLNLPPGSEVITPALTFSTDVATIYQAGYVPVFVDVGLDDYQILADRVEEAISDKTRAVLVPDLIGGIGDWDKLRAIADRHDLQLVHDSCDTLGGSLRGRKTATRADISVTSFSIFHIITALGNGGMVFFDSDDLLDRALMLRAWGRSSEKYMFGTRVAESDGRFLEKLDDLDYDSLFIFEDLAYGFIPNEAGAAFGLGQMNRIDELWQARNARFQAYYRFFASHADKFIVPRTLPETETTWICFPLQIRPETGWSRKALQVHLEDSGVFSRVIFSGNITRHPMLKGRDYRVHPAGLGNCDQIMEYGVMLPCHPTMSDEDQRYVEQVLEEFITANGNP